MEWSQARRAGSDLPSEIGSRAGTAARGTSSFHPRDERHAFATRVRGAAIALAFLLAGALPGRAGEGVFEINQACADETGCFVGDSAGLPVTIDSRGIFRLTGDLKLPDENTNGIVIRSDHVTLDLGGFAIQGPVGCTGTPTTCTPSTGTGVGISVSPPGGPQGVRIQNGIVTGVGNDGIRISNQSEVRNVTIRSNGLNGIGIGSDSRIVDNVVALNGGFGIAAGVDVVVSGNAVSANGLSGISVVSGALVSGNVANQNGAAGIVALLNSTIADNVLRSNQSSGILAGSGATVSRNTVASNSASGIVATAGSVVSGNTSYGNAANGIQCTDACLVIGNSARSNGAFGLSGSGGATAPAYRENLFSGNTGGSVLGGINQGNNTCDGVVCP